MASRERSHYAACRWPGRNCALADIERCEGQSDHVEGRGTHSPPQYRWVRRHYRRHSGRQRTLVWFGTRRSHRDLSARPVTTEPVKKTIGDAKSLDAGSAHSRNLISARRRDRPKARHVLWPGRSLHGACGYRCHYGLRSRSRILSTRKSLPISSISRLFCKQRSIVRLSVASQGAAGLGRSTPKLHPIASRDWLDNTHPSETCTFPVANTNSRRGRGHRGKGRVGSLVCFHPEASYLKKRILRLVRQPG
jgi:hypothetical protein